MRSSINRNFGRLTLGFALSILLGSFAFTTSYAQETYRHFTGSNYIETAASPALQLAQFTVEARFRVADSPPERGYIVSKGASDTGHMHLDHNYALFLTQTSAVGGGFKAADGTYYYVQSGALSIGSWHVAKLVYDGAKLRLFVDGLLKNSLIVTKKPDMSDAGPAMIGTSAYKLDNFFIGDMDYVKIMDRSTYKVKYYNSFDTSASPIYPPPPDPSPSGDCSDIPMSQLRGVAFMDPVLTRNEKGASIGTAADYAQESMKYLHSYGFNLIRVHYYWESYVYNPSDFMNRLDLIAKTAQANDICVVFDNHHWFTSSYWNTDIGLSGKAIGFPSFVVKSFPSKATYHETAAPFWNALLSNTLSIDGKKIWDLQADFLTKVVNKVDNYNSIAGYEILNEPHLWSKDQYEKLGNYHTYMAQKIRSVTDKRIIFDRETAHGFMRDPTMEHKVVPLGVNNLVYGPHLYAAPTEGSGGENQVQQIKKWKQEWGVEIMIGEFSGHSQSDMTAYLKAWKDGGFGWTYWKWSKATSTAGDHLGNVAYESDTVPKTEVLKWILYSHASVY